MHEFFDYLRGLRQEIPTGYNEQGMRLYRHLVALGVRQQLEAHYPELPEQLGQDTWTSLLQAFIAQSAWSSHFYGDLVHEFTLFLERSSQNE